MRRPCAALAVVLGCLGAVAAASAQSQKPRVPPGVDPGGVAVAHVGSGIDYTHRDIAGRIARDGEGELLGWDFIDNDRRPFNPCSVSNTGPACGTAQAWALLTEAPGSRLVAVRASALQPQTLVGAVRLVAQSPARIVLLAPGEGRLAQEFVATAAQHFAGLLFIVEQRHLEAPAAGSAGATLPGNVLVAQVGGGPEAATRMAAAAARAFAGDPTLRPPPAGEGWPRPRTS